MPGNPLPKIEINASRWPYDESGPANGKFGQVEVTAAPKAVFDATANPSQALNTRNGAIVGRNNLSLEQYPNELTPDNSGDRGWRIRHAARPNPWDDNNREMYYDILIDTFETYHHLKLLQPANFYHRKCVSVEGDLAQASNWTKGDTVTTSDGETGVFYGHFPNSEDGNVVVFENYTGQWSLNWSNRTITNDVSGESFYATDSHLIGANNKLFHEWVEGEYSYPNGGLKIEFDAAGDGNSKIKANISEAYKNGEMLDPRTFSNNEAPNQAGSPIIFDRVDNGYEIEFVMGRKRSTTIDSTDGGMFLWKKVNRPGSPFQSWTLLYQQTGLNVWGDNSQGTPNAPTRGYFFGAANSGYELETDWWMKSWYYWTQKPTFLTEAGV